MDFIEQKEAEFHDEWAKSTDLEKVFVDQAFESISSPENRQIISWMGNIRDKKILELGCGLGEASVYFAKQGAEVTATDISPQMVETVKKLAHLHKTQVRGEVVSANNLNNIPDDYYDYIYAGNLLHHVEIRKCVTDLHRKLKKNGVAFFWDPIAYNPVINVYRKIATKVRTDDEHPLRTSDIADIKNIFSKVDLRFFWLTSLVIFIWYYFVKRIDPNKERYWKKILEDSNDIAPLLKITHAIDAFLFKFVPPLRYLAWNVVIKAVK